jgi:hypothetical protein
MRAAASLLEALRVARGALPWMPWNDRHPNPPLTRPLNSGHNTPASSTRREVDA